ncbi:predicted protein [Nematostella vectensis]|uniref:G-protein coupled receptors family 1 profile domain-containing protein n=1 Tax=Nematostella vectensis TaxID=45351 RepID=A7T2C6_NEMVE|nr:predicted protein [Nematostella vectensis]|eukprot:XP_001621987.1 hypothetical protein NEMVEDRAFT_v1g221316 [Nematostella vectensis]
MAFMNETRLQMKGTELMSFHNGTTSLPPDVQDLVSLYDTLLPLFASLAFVSLLFAMFANILVILIGSADPRNHNMASLFLLNISAAGIFYAGVNVVGEIIMLRYDVTRLQSSCVVQPLTSLQMILYSVLAYSVTGLCIERYLSKQTLDFPSYENIDERLNIKLTIFAAIWISSVAILAPIGLCSAKLSVAYLAFLIIFLHAFPLLGIFISNILHFKLTNNSVVPGPIVGNVTIYPIDQSERSLLASIVITLIVTWTPFHVVFVVGELSEFSSIGIYRFDLVRRAMQMLAHWNVLLNPVLFYKYATNLREGFNSIVVFCIHMFRQQ